MDDEALLRDLEAAARLVFGPQPLSTTMYLRDPNDHGDAEDGPGVPVVLKELGEQENEAVLRAVGAIATPEEKLAAWTRETLVRALVSFDGKPMPADVEKRRQFFRRWPHGVIVAMKEHYEWFLGYTERARLAVERSPNPPGADAGLSSAPKGAGPIETSAA